MIAFLLQSTLFLTLLFHKFEYRHGWSNSNRSRPRCLLTFRRSIAKARSCRLKRLRMYYLGRKRRLGSLLALFIVTPAERVRSRL